MRVVALVVAVVLSILGGGALVSLAAPPAQSVQSLPYLGVYLSDQGGAITIVRVDSGSPAEQAGLQRGDIILSLNGKTVSTAAEWSAAYATLPAGTPVTIGISRSGTQSTVSVTLISRQGASSRPAALQWLDSLTTQQQFDAERRSSQSYQDTSGASYVVQTTPGIVGSVVTATNTIVITANGGVSTTVTVSSTTMYRGYSSVTEVRAGDRVYVSALQSAPTQAIVVARWNAQQQNQGTTPGNQTGAPGGQQGQGGMPGQGGQQGGFGGQQGGFGGQQGGFGAPQQGRGQWGPMLPPNTTVTPAATRTPTSTTKTSTPVASSTPASKTSTPVPTGTATRVASATPTASSPTSTATAYAAPR